MLFVFLWNLQTMQLKKILFFSLGLSCNTFAASAFIPTTTDDTLNKASKQMILRLSNKELTVLKARNQSIQNTQPLSNHSFLPEKTRLGMNYVPVLDQGNLLNDSVFASTAAIDAALGKGDYISQLCLIQLSNYMNPSQDTFFPLRKELSMLENYGVVIKKAQEEAGCNESAQGAINYEDYHRVSADLSAFNIIWASILDMNKAFSERTNTEKTLHKIQEALHNKNRVTVSFLVPQIDESDLGTVGTHHEKNDTWLLSKKIERTIYHDPALFFHSMIITGYDNKAITLDDEGQKHTGLLTLRSSWGQEAGDQGDFYMSYDYFRVFVLEAQQIIRH